MAVRSKSMTKRAQALRAENQQAMREKIANTQTVNQITKIEDELYDLSQLEAPNNGRVGALKAVLDSKWKRIECILPKLSAIDLNAAINADGRIEVSWVAPEE